MGEKAVDRSGSTQMVTVGCKLATGLVMEIMGKSENMTQSPQRLGERYIIAGANSLRQGTGAQARYPAAFTQVPRDFALAWFERHKNTAMVVNGFVFMEETEKDAKAHAAEVLKEQTGIEPLKRDGKDDRVKSVDLPITGALGGSVEAAA